MLYFICIGSAELLGTGRELKFQNDNMSPAGAELTPAATRKLIERPTPLDHQRGRVIWSARLAFETCWAGVRVSLESYTFILNSISLRL